MSTAEDKLKKILEASPLFSETKIGSTQKELNLDKLTEKQALSLARKGRAGDTGTSKISGGMSKGEQAILDTAGQKLAQQPDIVVSNVQRSKTWRADPRTKGGKKLASSYKAPQAKTLPDMPKLPPLPDMPAPKTGGDKGSTALALGIGYGKMVAKTLGKGAGTAGPTAIGGGLTGAGGSFLSAGAAAGLGNIGADSMVAQGMAQATGMHPALFGAPSLTNQMIATSGSSGLPGAANIGAAASKTGSLLSGNLLPLVGFGLQAYNILKIGGVFGGKESGSNSINYIELLRRAEAGEKSISTYQKGGRYINWDLTDKDQLEYIRSKIPNQLLTQRASSESDKLGDRSDHEEARGLGYRDPVSRLGHTKWDTQGRSLADITAVVNEKMGPEWTLDAARAKAAEDYHNMR